MRILTKRVLFTLIVMRSELIIKYFPNITDDQISKFEQLYQLYFDWNSKINVISRKDIDDIYLHHILHSLAIAKFSEVKGGVFFPGCSVIDVGTGGGFPGIPLAIFFPEVKFTLCDSIGKKIKVVDGVTASLRLTNVKTYVGRVEELDSKFDYVVSRAVAQLSDFFPLIKATFTKGAIFLKGGDTDVEIERFKGGDYGSKQILFNSKNRSIETFLINDFFEEDYFNQKKIIFLDNICR